MSPEDMANAESGHNNLILRQAIFVTEVATDLKERHIAAEKYLNYLKSMIHGAERAVAGLQLISSTSYNLAQKLLQTHLQQNKLSDELKLEYDNLQVVLNREMSTRSDSNPSTTELNLDQLAEKIRILETRNRTSENHVNTSSSRSSKVDINEKFPEDLSRESSLIDLNAFTNLATVPEDIFTGFSNNKPTRTSSLSSLKNMRKVKLFLQKAESSDDDDSSDNEEHDYSRLVYGDSDESKTISPKKLHLGNIKEEGQD